MNDIMNELYTCTKKTLKETIAFQLPNYHNNGFIEKTYGKSKGMINLYRINIVPIHYVQYHVPKQRNNHICKYTKKGRKTIHTGLECMNYEIIRKIVEQPFWQETVELNDVIIPKCACQYGKCYISGIEINEDNINFIHKTHKQ